MSLTTTDLAPYERLTRARLFAGLDQADIAARLGKSRNTVSAWERGVNEPPISAVAAWALITGRTLEWIMWGDAGKPEAPADVAGASEWCARRDSNSQPSEWEHFGRLLLGLALAQAYLDAELPENAAVAA